jgi:VanZ family protein
VNAGFIGRRHAGAMDGQASSVSTARWLLLSACMVCAFGMLGPFRGIERAVVPWDKAAHFIAFYGITLLAFSAFPKRRRMDLVVQAICAGAAMEVLQSMVGRDGQVGDIVADAAGALAVFAPMWLERRRELRIERRKISSLKISVIPNGRQAEPGPRSNLTA